MNMLRQEILQESTAGYLAKQDEFAKSPEYYADRAQQYHGGNTSVVDEVHTEALTIHSLMADDDEHGVLNRYPHLRDGYASCDIGQVEAAHDERNLDFFLEGGIEY